MRFPGRQERSLSQSEPGGRNVWVGFSIIQVVRVGVDLDHVKVAVVLWCSWKLVH